MANLKIESIFVKTVGGFDAELTAIDPANNDCISGVIKGKSATNVRWDIHGRCRDNHPDCNLDMRTDELQDLVDTIKSISPRV